MRVVIKLILCLVLVIGFVAFGFSFWQTYQEGRNLKEKLDARSAIYAGTFRPALESLFDSQSPDSLRDFLNSFSVKERLLGITVHDAEKKLVLVSDDLSAQPQQLSPILNHIFSYTQKTRAGYGEFVELNDRLAYAHTQPFLVNGTVVYELTFFYGTGSIYGRIKQLWIDAFFRLLVQVFFIALAMAILVYFVVVGPIKKTTEWVKKVRRGETPPVLDPKNEKILGPLTREISQMAKSLVRARSAAEKEARLRHSSESLWTPERLKEFIKARLNGKPIFVVSNPIPLKYALNHIGFNAGKPRLPLTEPDEKSANLIKETLKNYKIDLPV